MIVGAGRSLIRGGVCSSAVRGRVREEREEGPRSMTRNGHGPPGGVGVMAAAGKEKGAKVVYGDGSWQLTIFVTDLQVNASVEPTNPE